MSKKFIILIQLVVCVIAVVMISLYGRNPEMWKDFEYCEVIYFLYDSARVESGTEIEIPRAEEGGTLTYQLEWYVGPEDASVKEVRFHSNSSNVVVDENGLVTFLSDEGATIYIFTTDNSLLSANIKLTIGLPGGGELPF